MQLTIQERSCEVPDKVDGTYIAQFLKMTDPAQAVAISVNGKLVDFSSALSEGDRVELYSFDQAIGKEVFWHTSAHLLAQAVLRLYPTARPTIGPPIEEGFYYDFHNLSISEHDFPKIEAEMSKILEEKLSTQRIVFQDKKEALAIFKDNPFKVELIEGLDEKSEITAYRQGEFVDLCRGPHLANLSKIKAFKILKTSAAYWRGDVKNPTLTRLYAISFPDKKQLAAYLQRIEEAKKRDHRKLGAQLDLYGFYEEAPGMPFFHPHGMRLLNKLLQFWRDLHKKAGYIEIKTPTMLTQSLWETSGHWDHYRHNMFVTTIEEKEYAIKPMNCPGCMLFFKNGLRSYRQFPLRVAEVGHVHRYEFSGALSGLFRVRAFTQDDAHIFMRHDMIEEEILRVLGLADLIYSTFGLSYAAALSTRPPKEQTIGTDEDWERATEGLRAALDRTQKPYTINEGDGAFYGPKIDIRVFDALGRPWQCATIQLDMSLPERFDLYFIDEDGKHKRPVMAHRALFGSIERFIGILVEHFAGKFPLWISPYPITIMTVADRHQEHAFHLREQFEKAGFECDVDHSEESIGKKVRAAQLLKTNYMITVGDKEIEEKTLSVRSRSGKVMTMTLDLFLEKLREEETTRALDSWMDLSI